MSVFPDFLFRLSPRDEQVTPLEIVNIYFYGAPASSTQVSSNTYTVPKGKVLLVNSVGAYMYAGAAQKAQDVVLINNTSTGNVFYHWSHDWNADIGQFRTACSNTSFILGENYAVKMLGEFDVGAVDNYFEGHINGILIPRGNFAI